MINVNSNDVNELLKAKAGGNYGVGGNLTPAATGGASDIFFPSASQKLNDMIDNMSRAATTRIAPPTQTQAALMNDALSAQLGVAGITGESARGVMEKAKLDAEKYKDNAGVVAKQLTPTTPVVLDVNPSAPPSYDDAWKSIRTKQNKKIITPIRTEKVGGG